MTPKEKAKELYNKFLLITDNEVYNDAKEAALIVVDEILNNAGFIYKTARDAYRKYWQQVRQEIENL